MATVSQSADYTSLLNNQLLIIINTSVYNRLHHQTWRLSSDSASIWCFGVVSCWWFHHRQHWWIPFRRGVGALLKTFFLFHYGRSSVGLLLLFIATGENWNGLTRFMGQKTPLKRDWISVAVISFYILSWLHTLFLFSLKLCILSIVLDNALSWAVSPRIHGWEQNSLKDIRSLGLDCNNFRIISLANNRGLKTIQSRDFP